MVWNHLCDAGKIGSSPEDGVSVTAASLEFSGWNPQNQLERVRGQKKSWATTNWTCDGQFRSSHKTDYHLMSKWSDLSDTGRIEPLAAHAGRSGRCLKRSAVKRPIQINSRPRYGGCWWNIDVSACHGSILRILLDDVVQNAIKKTWPTKWDIFCLNAFLNGVNYFRPSSFGQLSHPLGEIHGPCNFVQLRLFLKKRLG